MKLQEYLDYNEMTITEFARDIDVSVALICFILKNKRKVTLKIAKRIVVATKGKVTIKDLCPEIIKDIKEMDKSYGK